MPNGVPTGDALPEHVRLPIGGQSKFTDRNRKIILAALRTGARPVTAANAAGISVETFRDWMKKGRASIDGEGNPSGPLAEFGQFMLDCDQVSALAVIDNFKEIVKHGKGETVVKKQVIKKKDGSVVEIEERNKPDWTALAWATERSHDEYKQNNIGAEGQAARQINNTINIVYIDDWRNPDDEINRHLANANEDGVIEGTFHPLELEAAHADAERVQR